MFKCAAATTIAFATLASTPSMAATKLTGVDLKPWTGQFVGSPTIEVKRDKSGKLYVPNTVVQIPVRTGGKVENVLKRYMIYEAKIFVDAGVFGKGGAYDIMPPNNPNRNVGVRSINDNRSLPFVKAHLGPVVKQAIDRCTGYRGKGEKAFPIQIPLALSVKAGEIGASNFTEVVRKTAYTNIDANVRCPGAGGPVRDPGSASTPIPPKVKSVKLAIVNGVIRSCPKKVFVVGTFETDKAGKFEVILRRDNGNTERRTISAVKKAGKFIAKFEKTYTINADTRRKYMIEVAGQAKASAWIPMTVNCKGPGASGEKGGLKLK